MGLGAIASVVVVGRGRERRRGERHRAGAAARHGGAPSLARRLLASRPRRRLAADPRTLGHRSLLDLVHRDSHRAVSRVAESRRNACASAPCRLPAQARGARHDDRHARGRAAVARWRRHHTDRQRPGVHSGTAVGFGADPLDTAGRGGVAAGRGRPRPCGRDWRAREQLDRRAPDRSAVPHERHRVRCLV